MQTNDHFVFRKLDSVGAADAEDDKEFLADCFVDTGDIQALLDCKNPRRLVLGRTGFGKSALLVKLTEEAANTINIKPESLALSYISNSTILRFVSHLGVKLDIFFKLLWRHVFTVELLKAHFRMEDKAAEASWISRIKGLFKEQKHQRALDYLENWGKSFWEDTDYRIKELTTKLESDLSASLGAHVGAAKLCVIGWTSVSVVQKEEVVHRANNVINQVQIRELSEVIEVIDTVLEDPLKPYYILIDRLDENWVDDQIKCVLVRALIETVRDFRKVRHAKIIVALRLDLIDRVFRLTRDSGFQEEKYESLFLNVQWSKDQLAQMLEGRINRLIRKRYTKQPVSYRDVLPASIDGKPPIEYMTERTMMRPRDLILFFNACLSYAVDKPVLTSDMIKTAEGEYSRGRLRSIADEWHADYPNLPLAVDILKNRRATFAVASITEVEAQDFAVNLIISEPERQDDILSQANRLFENMIAPRDFLRAIVQIFYRAGIAGLKLEKHESVVWAISGRRTISMAEIGDDTRVIIHPCLWRTLGVNVTGR